jgi:phosphoserine phosphatase
MEPPKARVAIAYDFDGTLAPGNMQEQSFLPAVKAEPEGFWQEARAHAKKHDMDEILAYMELMLKRSREAEAPILRDTFKGYGKKIRFFAGVESWFGRIDACAKKEGVELAHYIISSGNRETIEGCRIAGHFRGIYASAFRYDENGVAVWPALAVNYTNKAQFLFRINKGIENAHDNSRINKYTPEDKRPYPFKNFVYIGDGETDIPAMKMVTYQGGKSIVVYPDRPGRREAAHELVEQQRADIAAPADYSKGSVLERAVKAAIRQVAARHEFEQCDTSAVKGFRPPK